MSVWSCIQAAKFSKALCSATLTFRQSGFFRFVNLQLAVWNLLVGHGQFPIAAVLFLAKTDHVPPETRNRTVHAAAKQYLQRPSVHQVLEEAIGIHSLGQPPSPVRL